MHTHWDWTYDTDKYKDLPAIVKDLHEHGQHYIMIVVCVMQSTPEECMAMYTNIGLMDVVLFLTVL